MISRRSRHLVKSATALLIIALLLPGCSTGVVVHDELRAAELIVDFLSSLKSDEGIERSYAWTDDSYKERVSSAEFTSMVARLRYRNRGAEIRLTGFEIFGPVEVINVYASSSAGEDELYFRFILTGTRSKDYYLLNFSIEESAFDKKGVYREYRRPIAVDGL